MAQSIQFFPRQVLMSDLNSQTDYYSEIYDATDFAHLCVELVVYANSQASYAVALQIFECEDPYMNDAMWTQVGSTLNQTTPGRAKTTISDPLRFIRAKVSIYQDTSACIFVGGTARQP